MDGAYKSLHILHSQLPFKERDFTSPIKNTGHQISYPMLLVIPCSTPSFQLPTPLQAWLGAALTENPGSTTVTLLLCKYMLHFGAALVVVFVIFEHCSSLRTKSVVLIQSFSLVTIMVTMLLLLLWLQKHSVTSVYTCFSICLFYPICLFSA